MNWHSRGGIGMDSPKAVGRIVERKLTSTLYGSW